MTYKPWCVPQTGMWKAGDACYYLSEGRYVPAEVTHDQPEGGLLVAIKTTRDTASWGFPKGMEFTAVTDELMLTFYL